MVGYARLEVPWWAMYGETDDFCYSVLSDVVHIRVLNATIRHSLGVEHNAVGF